MPKNRSFSGLSRGAKGPVDCFYNPVTMVTAVCRRSPMISASKMINPGYDPMTHAPINEANTEPVMGDATRPMMMRICVVSEDFQFHAAIREILAPMGIWDVSAFASFQDARDRAGGRSHDLIIVDCPQIASLATNFIAERRASSDDAFAEAQVLVVMGSITRGVLTHLRQCGADSVMLKPLRAGALSVRVRRLLGLRSDAIDDRLAA